MMERLNQLEARVGPGPISQAAVSLVPPLLVDVSPVPPVGSASVGPALQRAQLLVEKAAKELEQEGVKVVKLREKSERTALSSSRSLGRIQPWSYGRCWCCSFAVVPPRR